MVDSHVRSILKSTIWRILGVLVLGIVTYGFTQHWIQTTIVTFVHHGAFLIIFYLHERVWFKVRLRLWVKHLLKAFTYEIILGNLVLGTITWLVTGSWWQVTNITLTYIGIKLVMYPIYDWLWTRRKIVYAYVVGDILHIGHLQFLAQARQAGDKLIVGVLTDEATMEKKPCPVVPFSERLETISAIKYVSSAIPQFTYSPLDNVKKIRPHILIESESHKEQPANDFVHSYGGQVLVLPYYNLQSSTSIKNKIKLKDR